MFSRVSFGLAGTEVTRFSRREIRSSVPIGRREGEGSLARVNLRSDGSGL